MSFSANIGRLQPSATIAVSTLAKRLRAEGRDIIDLSAGEPDFDTPDFIAEAGRQAIADGHTRYTPAPGKPELRQAIADALSRRSGRELDGSGVVVSCGAKQALFNACFSLFGPGDEVLIASPYWTSYPQIVGLCRAEPVFVAGDPTRGFKLTPDDLERAAGPETRGLIFSSPCNPTGAVYSRDELAALAAWARDRGVWLVSDEIYQAIYYGDEGDRAAGLLDLRDDDLGDYVIVDGVSKSFAMTGWRIGFCYTSPELARKVSALQSHTTSNPATPSQMAALAAYSNAEASSAAVGTMLQAFRRRRDLVTGLMDEELPEMAYVPPEGAFYLFFRVDSAFDDEIQDAQAFCTRLLEETGVALVPGNAFGDDRFVRASYATSDELLRSAIERMAGLLSGV